MSEFVEFAIEDGKIKKFNKKTNVLDNSTRSYLEKLATEFNVDYTKETTDEHLLADYCSAIQNLPIEKDTTLDNEVLTVSEDKTDSVEFVAWKVAIDIHNGVYGQYRNQQEWAFAEVGFTREQIEEAILISEMIH